MVTVLSLKTFSGIKLLENKVFYLCLSFFAVPLVVYSVLTGIFISYLPLFLVAFALIVLCLVILCVLNKKNIRGAVIISALVFSALFSSLFTYTNEYRNAESVVEAADGTKHKMGGYVVKGDFDTGSSFFVSITEIDGRELKYPVNAQGFNYTGYYLYEGSFLEFEAKLKSLDEDYDSVYRPWLESKGVHTKLESMSNTVINDDKSRFSAASWARNLFGDALTKLYGGISGGEKFDRVYSLSRAMMLGDKSKLNDETKDNFSKSGIIHILCVSGLHFSVMLGGLSVLFKYTVPIRTARNILLVALSLFYLCICGFSGSALRAAVMAFIAGMSVSGASRNNCTHNLMAAVCFICIINPGAVFDGGFRMSCICCAGIMCSSYISEAVCRRLRYHPISCLVMSSLLVSFSASAFLFPYSLCSFGGVSTVSVIASTVTVLPAQIFLILCFVAVFLSVLGIGFINAVMSALISLFADYICGVAEFFAKLEFSYTESSFPDFSFLVFIVIMACAAITGYSKRRAATVYLYIASASVIGTSVLLITAG